MSKMHKYIYDWPRPMVSVDAVVFKIRKNKVELLLIQRGREPFKGNWALPGGFVGIDEELDKAAERELEEETGLKNVPLKQMHTFGAVGRDPRGRQITVVYMGIAEEQKQIKAGDDAANARWFDIDKLPKELAFDHNDVVNHAIGKLKRKKQYRQSIKKSRGLI